MNDSEAASSHRSKLRQYRLAQIENEQMLEDREALRMTEEQHRILLDSFKGVKTEFSDLDGLSYSREAKRYPSAPTPSPTPTNVKKLDPFLVNPFQHVQHHFQVITNARLPPPDRYVASTVRAPKPPLLHSKSSESTIRPRPSPSPSFEGGFVPHRAVESRTHAPHSRRKPVEGIFTTALENNTSEDDDDEDGDKTFRSGDPAGEDHWDATVAWGRGRSRTPVVASR